jgi:oligopeptide/dipeptide ABC transporter ATP-binding protein
MDWVGGGAVENDVTHIQGGPLKDYRRRVQMVFQDPASSLNPYHTIESILSLPLRIYEPMTRKERERKVGELLEAVHLPVEFRKRKPSALSGGQKQRVALARALALRPVLCILDEPTSALDVSVQAKILQLLQELKETYALTFVLITHDLVVVRNMADRVAVMYLGRIVELGRSEAIFERPRHPYTQALLSAIPVVTEEEKRMLPSDILLEGEIPSPANQPPTCPFRSRCPDRLDRCENSLCPDLIMVENEHWVRCWRIGGRRKFFPAEAAGRKEGDGP